jgi:hypothetical protein
VRCWDECNQQAQLHQQLSKEDLTMKWRFTPLLLLIFLLATSASWADTVLVGSLDLFNNGTADTLQLTNTTGQGASAPANTVANAETFSGLSLTINGSSVSFDTTQEPVAANGGFLDFGDAFAPNSITSLMLGGNLSGPTMVTVNGSQVQIGSTLSASYVGAALGEPAHIDVFAQTVSAPEPAVIPLFGMAVWFLRRRPITG